MDVYVGPGADSSFVLANSLRDHLAQMDAFATVVAPDDQTCALFRKVLIGCDLSRIAFLTPSDKIHSRHPVWVLNADEMHDGVYEKMLEGHNVVLVAARTSRRKTG